MKKQEMNSLVAGLKLQSKKDLAVYTIVGIDLKQGKVILDNGKLYTMGTIQRWYSLYEEDNTDTEEQEDTDTIAPKFNLGDKVVTNFGVGEVVSVPHLVELDGKVTMSNYRVAIYEDGQRYLFDYKEEQLEAYTEDTTTNTTNTVEPQVKDNTEDEQDTEEFAGESFHSEQQEDTSDLKDDNTQVNKVHEDTDTTTKIEVVEGNTATTEELELDEDLEVILAQLGCTATKRKEYLGIYKQRYRGCVAMLRNSKEGNLHIDMKEKIYKALDEEVREQIEADYDTGIYDKTRGYFRIKDCDNLRVLAVVLRTALQLAELIG